MLWRNLWIRVLPQGFLHELLRWFDNQLDIKLGQFTQEELDVVLTKLKTRKAIGLDELPPEVWKTRKFNDLLLWYCNAVYNQNTIERWTKICISPFSKKGDFRIAKNYRGITLTSIVAKIYIARLINHIEPEIEKILWKNQNGFWRKGSTHTHTHTHIYIYIIA